MRPLTLAILSALPCFGAATIQIASVTLNADGRTFTAAMSGVTGTLSCTANACTGVTVNAVNGLATVSVVSSIVGGALQIVTVGPVTSTEVPTITLASSNITDSSSNSQVVGGANTAHAVTNGSKWYFATVAPFSTVARKDGGGTVAHVGGADGASWIGSDGALSITGNFTSVNAFVFDDPAGGGVYRLYEDGSELASAYTTPTDNTYSIGTGWTTNSSGTHTYRLRNTSTYAGGSGGSSTYLIAMVQLVGGTGLGTIPAALNMGMACGDSITIGNTGATPVISDSRQMDYYLASDPLSAIDQHYGVSGGHASTANPPVDCFTPAAYVVAGAGATMKWFQWNFGVNDLDDGVTAGTTAAPGCDAAEFECGYYTSILNVCLQIDCTTVKLFSRAVLPNNYGPNSGTGGTVVAAWNVHMAHAVSLWNADNPTKTVCYFDTAGVYPATQPTYMRSDDLHITAAAYAKVGNLEMPILSGALTGSSYTLTFAATGTTGTRQSGTLTRMGGGTWTGSETVTLTDSSGGVFCYGGTCSSGFLAITPTAAAVSAQTVTYTPSTSGSKTVAPTTASQCWISPASPAITVSAPSPAPSTYVF